jgi:hypothetical protein
MALTIGADRARNKRVKIRRAREAYSDPPVSPRARLCTLTLVRST